MSAGKLTGQAKGVYIIAATPFTDDGALDLQSVDRLTDFYLGCGVHGFTLLGMMGEAHKLTTEELIDVVKRVIARGGDRHQVIVGVSHAGIENVRRLAHEVMIAGAAGVMVAPPAGLKGDDGIYNYYAQVFAALRSRSRRERTCSLHHRRRGHPYGGRPHILPWGLHSHAEVESVRRALRNLRKKGLVYATKYPRRVYYQQPGKKPNTG